MNAPGPEAEISARHVRTLADRLSSRYMGVERLGVYGVKVGPRRYPLLGVPLRALYALIGPAGLKAS